MDGYYDPMLTPVPDKPVALCGFAGAGVLETASAICHFSGLTFVDVERRMEHELGSSLEQHVRKSGMDGLADIEHRAIHRGLRENPPPIIALRPFCLLDERNLRMLERHSTLIYIERNIFLLFSRILDQLENNLQTRMLEFQGHDPRDITSMSRLLSRMEPLYKAADHRIDAVDKHPRELARDVLKLICD